jgi:ribonuclease kappa
MAICGPKLSLVGVILSAWGIVQLSLMGVFFYTKSVALIEDVPLEEEYESEAKLITDMETGFQQNALNCWIAALLYLVTLCVSVQQFWMNNRSTYSV